MAILNKSFPYINVNLRDDDQQIDYRTDSIYIQLDHWNDHDYWYCEIFMGECFYKYKIETLISSDILNKIKTDDNTFLVICNSHEAFHSIVGPIYKTLIIESKIPAKKIILMSESADLCLAVKKVADNLHQEYVNVLWATAFQHGMKLDKKNIDKSQIEPAETLTSKSYPKKFINLNRRWRLHRPVTVALLKCLNLLEYGYVSISQDINLETMGLTWANTYEWMIKRYNYDPINLNLIKSNMNEITDMPDMYVDTTDLKTNRAILTDSTDYYYANSLFSLVSETNFYNDSRQGGGRFLSEKTFKPIAKRHPFIIITVPRTLELIRSIGYKTFHPWINEDYDLELDDDLRLNKILKEVERICHLTDSEVEEFLINVRPIVEHNYTILMNKEINLRKML